MAVKKQRVVALVWCNPFSGNFGVGALGYATLHLIQSILDERGAAARFLLIGNADEGRRRITVGKRTIEVRIVPRLRFMSLRGCLARLARPFRHETCDLLRSDVVFDVSEGDSFTDLYGRARFERILDTKVFFNLLGKRQVLLPQTIGPFKDPRHERAAFSAMRRATKVMARDGQSYAYAQPHMDGAKLEELIDVAFALPYERRTHAGGKIHVGVNVSALLWNGGYTRDNQFQLNVDYVQLMRRVLAHLSSDPRCVVHLVAHVIAEHLPVENDHAVAAALQAELPGTVLAPKFAGPVEAKSYIAGLDFFVGARMHACIAAFSAGVPVYPLAYSRKFNGLFRDTLRYAWMGDCVNEDESTIFERFADAFSQRERVKEAIRSSNQDIVQPRLRRLEASLSGALGFD